MTVKDRYPLPLIGNLIDQIRGAQIFSKIDLRSAYNLVRIKPGDEWKTAFRCRYGHFQYKVMPFGLANAPAVFQRLMNEIFSDVLDVFVVIYLDDVLIYSDTPDHHNEHVSLVLQRLRENGLYAKLEKCVFDVDWVEFCGYVIGKDGIRMSDGKVEAIRQWPTPTTLLNVRSFLVLANFYRHFVQGYSGIAKPLTDLTKKAHPFVWGAEQQTAFDSLRQAIASEPVLRHPDISQPFVLETDASDFALGAVLHQLVPSESRPRPPCSVLSLQVHVRQRSCTKRFQCWCLEPILDHF
jgi:hypothetical protein